MSAPFSVLMVARADYDSDALNPASWDFGNQTDTAITAEVIKTCVFPALSRIN
jgi:hypothetical protein